MTTLSKKDQRDALEKLFRGVKKHVAQHSHVDAKEDDQHRQDREVLLNLYIGHRKLPRYEAINVWHDAKAGLRWATTFSIPMPKGQPLRGPAHLKEVIAKTKEKMAAKIAKIAEDKATNDGIAESTARCFARMAKYHRFRYFITRRPRGLVVTIRLDSRYGLDVDVPFADHTAALALVPRMLKSARALYALHGARVAVAQATTLRIERGRAWRGPKGK